MATYSFQNGGKDIGTVTLTEEQEAKLATNNPNLAVSLASSRKPIQTTTIPTSVIDNPTPALSFPTPQPSPDISATQAAVEQFAKGYQSQFDQASQQKNTSVNTMRSLFAASLGKGDEIERREAEAGIPVQQQQLNELMGRINTRTQALKMQDIANEKAVLDLEGRGGRLTSSVGRQQALLAREQAFQRRADAAELEGLAAAASLMQGNINQARDSIERAVSYKYDDIDKAIKAEMFFLDDVKDTLSTAEKGLAEAKRAQLDAQLQVINDARKLSMEAAMSGYASPGEIEALFKKGTTPEQTQQLASSILSRSAAAEIEMRNLQLQKMRAEVSGSNDKEATQRTADTEKALGIAAQVNELLNHSGFNNAIGPNPLTRPGTPISGDKADFLAKVEQLKNLLTLDNLKLMSGVLTDKDILILQNAASRLGATKVSQAAYREALTDIQKVANRTITKNGITEEQAVYFGILAPDDLTEINELFPSSSDSFNPASYFSN